MITSHRTKKKKENYFSFKTRHLLPASPGCLSSVPCFKAIVETSHDGASSLVLEIPTRAASRNSLVSGRQNFHRENGATPPEEFNNGRYLIIFARILENWDDEKKEDFLFSLFFWYIPLVRVSNCRVVKFWKRRKKILYRPQLFPQIFVFPPFFLFQIERSLIELDRPISSPLFFSFLFHGRI